jgi:N-acetylglucosamine transport system permease protein
MLPWRGLVWLPVAILNFVVWNQFLLPIALNTNPRQLCPHFKASFASQAGYSVDFGALFAPGHHRVPVLIIYGSSGGGSGSVSRGTPKLRRRDRPRPAGPLISWAIAILGRWAGNSAADSAR